LPLTVEAQPVHVHSFHEVLHVRRNGGHEIVLVGLGRATGAASAPPSGSKGTEPIDQGISALDLGGDLLALAPFAQQHRTGAR
jgi:hypothetical protein